MGSLSAYLSHNRRAITGIQNELSVMDTHVICTSIRHALMASSPMYPTVFKTYKTEVSQTFSLKRSSQDIFLQF